jgi:hypothetical protein
MNFKKIFICLELDEVKLLNLSFIENSFNASIKFQVNGSCKEIRLLYEYESREYEPKKYETTLKSNCSGSSLEITEQVEIDNLEYGTLTSFRIATIGFDETNYSSEIYTYESNLNN